MTPPRPALINGVAMPLAAPKEVSVTPLGRIAQGDRWRTEAMRSYSVPVLIWVTRGQGRITMAGQRRGYGPFTLIFLPAGTMHGFDRMGPVSGSVVFLRQGQDLPWPETPVHLRLSESRSQMELTQQIEQIEQELTKDDDHRGLALQNLSGLLSVWLSRLLDTSEFEADSSRARDLAAAFTALVDRDFGTDTNIGGLAQNLGVTPTHLTRVCKETSGLGAHEVLANRRLFEARRLLLDTDLTVAEIARRSGFASAAYFSRSFKVAAGQSPRAFRDSRKAP